MAKTVFRPFEVLSSSERIALPPPAEFSDTPPEEAAPEEDAALEAAAAREAAAYTGPSMEELRAEADAFRASWEAEKQALIDQARAEADRIEQEAGERAEEERRRAGEEAEALRAEAKAEAEKILAEAKAGAERAARDAEAAKEEQRSAAEEAGRAAGREEGFAEGKAEVERLVERTRSVLERAQEKRAEILAETEQDVVELVLLVARKVVKVISENQKGVILQNVVQALRKVKTKGTVIIKVNTADLQLTTEHTKDFIKMLESAQNVQVQEDRSLEPGGCVILTDFGEIDARISSQFAELESKIRDLIPIKAKAKGVGSG
jgi:flagellar assembly protein FliH